jgi:hypothetical protein
MALGARGQVKNNPWHRHPKLISPALRVRVVLSTETKTNNIMKVQDPRILCIWLVTINDTG